MDSLTQIALGAAVGEAVLGKKAGNRAILWGAIGGVIPDLDLIPGALMGDIARITFHRGFTHSLLFSVLFAPLFGYIICKIYKNRSRGDFQSWTILMFLSIITHIMLDCFTAYGTQIFYPFSDYRVAFNTIAIVDPFYTVPLLASIIAALFFKRVSRKQQFLNNMGLIISTLYLVLTVFNKFYITSIFENRLKKQNITYSRIMTYPTILNNLLWQGVVEGEDTFYTGYYSLFDKNGDIKFIVVKKNHYLINDIKDESPIAKLKWFSKGYFSISKQSEFLFFNDMRYGLINGDNRIKFIFSFKIFKDPDDREKVIVKRVIPNKLKLIEPSKFFYRIIGIEIGS